MATHWYIINGFNERWTMHVTSILRKSFNITFTLLENGWFGSDWPSANYDIDKQRAEWQRQYDFLHCDHSTCQCNAFIHRPTTTDTIIIMIITIAYISSSLSELFDHVYDIAHFGIISTLIGIGGELLTSKYIYNDHEMPFGLFHIYTWVHNTSVPSPVNVSRDNSHYRFNAYDSCHNCRNVYQINDMGAYGAGEKKIPTEWFWCNFHRMQNSFIFSALPGYFEN